jgi:Ca-activated chloride channel family protein
MLFVGLAVLSSTPATAEDKGSSATQATLTWKLESSQQELPDTAAPVYLRLRIQVTEAVAKNRPPLTLALVFDRSGSMDEDQKIGYVRKAGHLVADNLTPQDHVAMVAYNHEVQILVGLHPVVNREYLHHRIDELFAEGWTNISGGLLEGYAQVSKRLREPDRHHVILLTDGLANRGVTNPDQLATIVERWQSRGITTTTIGVGTEYDERLLARVAEAGGGRYVHAAKPEQIPTAFDKELGALLAVVAQNTRFQMKLPSELEVDRVFGREAPVAKNELDISLGDMTAGEDRVVLVKLRRASGGSTGHLDLTGSLTFDDVLAAQRRNEANTIHFGEHSAADRSAVAHSGILAYCQLVEAVDMISLAVEGMDRELAARALQVRRSQYPELKRVAMASGDQEFVNKAFMFEHFADELEELIEAGALHEHSAERKQLQKELHYRRFMREHHRHKH